MRRTSSSESEEQNPTSQNRQKTKYMALLELVPTVEPTEKHDDFVVMDDFAKSEIDLAEITKRILAIVRKEHIDYKSFLDICQRVRTKAGLRKPKKQRTLPKLLSEADLKRFFRTIQDCCNVEPEVMLRLLFFTAIRVSELVNIKISDVDLGNCKIFIDQGKGSKDRYILFPTSFRLI